MLSTGLAREHEKFNVRRSDSSGREAPREDIIEWLENDPNVRKARELGVWSNLNDRIVANTPYFEAAEHSAQLDGPRLRTLERRFKDGELNVLSCSTTMEMGVDIGGHEQHATEFHQLSAAGRSGRTARRGRVVRGHALPEFATRGTGIRQPTLALYIDDERSPCCTR